MAAFFPPPDRRHGLVPERLSLFRKRDHSGGYGIENGSEFGKLPDTGSSWRSRHSIELLHPGCSQELKNPSTSAGTHPLQLNPGWSKLTVPDYNNAPGVMSIGSNRKGRIFRLGDHTSHIVVGRRSAPPSSRCQPDRGGGAGLTNCGNCIRASPGFPVKMGAPRKLEASPMMFFLVFSLSKRYLAAIR